ncbi:hypothetical protein ACN28S_16915 [Cystobacter fuscus]
MELSIAKLVDGFFPEDKLITGHGLDDPFLQLARGIRFRAPGAAPGAFGDGSKQGAFISRSHPLEVQLEVVRAHLQDEAQQRNLALPGEQVEQGAQQRLGLPQRGEGPLEERGIWLLSNRGPKAIGFQYRRVDTRVSELLDERPGIRGVAALSHGADSRDADWNASIWERNKFHAHNGPGKRLMGHAHLHWN